MKYEVIILFTMGMDKIILIGGFYGFGQNTENQKIRLQNIEWK